MLNDIACKRNLFTPPKTGFTTPTWKGYPAYPAESPQFTSAVPPASGEVGTAYSHNCTATGTPSPSFSLSAGALPDGLILSSAGVISGTPGAAGIFTGAITASNGIPPAVTQAFTIDTNEYRTLICGGSNGSVTGGGIYLLDATATLTVAANPGYVFSAWTGDATGTANPLSVPMNADKTITASFIHDTRDSDDDGLNNYDEAVIYGTNPAIQDTDGDGLTDGWELGLGRFTIIAGNFTWSQARADAHASGGELACFPTQDRWNRAMVSLGGATDYFTGLWIGASDAATEGIWTWVNGEPFSFTNWATSRPNPAPANSLDYAEVSGGGGAELDKWYDRTNIFVRDGYILETGYATNPLVADPDSDNLNDGAELAAGTNPFLADTDDDGLLDGQEVTIYNSNPKLADSDGDGFLDGAEVEFGGNPLLAAVVPEFKARSVLDNVAGTMQIRFLSQPGKSYSLEASADLVSWTLLEADIAGTGGALVRTYPLAAAPARYFRAKLE